LEYETPRIEVVGSVTEQTLQFADGSLTEDEN
jgi:hypothetical protein